MLVYRIGDLTAASTMAEYQRAYVIYVSVLRSSSLLHMVMANRC